MRRHNRELKEMERHYGALDRLEKRENRAAANAALREEYRKLRARSFALKPEFDKALARQQASADAGDGGSKKITALFNRLASGIGLTKGDLQAAFERATAGKIAPAGDTDTQGHAPADPEKLAERAAGCATNSRAASRRPAPTGTGSGNRSACYRLGRRMRRCPCTLRISSSCGVVLAPLLFAASDIPADFRRQPHPARGCSLVHIAALEKISFMFSSCVEAPAWSLS